MKFRMVDRIVSVSDEGIETVKTVSFEEFNLLEPWGRRGPLPESLVVQLGVESASLLVARRSEGRRIGVLEDLAEVRFERETRPGDVLRCRVTIQPPGFAFVVTRGSGLNRPMTNLYDRSVAGELSPDPVVASGAMTLTELDLARHYDPDAFRLQWTRLHAAP